MKETLKYYLLIIHKQKYLKPSIQSCALGIFIQCTYDYCLRALKIQWSSRQDSALYD